MARTVAEHLVDTLVQAGVRQIYGVVGDSLNPVTDAIRRSGTFQWVDVRHEETAAFAAGAEAQLTGRLAVCAGSCGPGNLHLINGLYDAHRSLAPVLAIAAHIPSSEIGTGYFQETHPDQLFRECSHYCELISNPRQLPRVMQSAVQHAVSKRGVSVIVLPGDVAALEAARGRCRARPRDGVPAGAAGGRRPGPPGRPRQPGEDGGALLRHRLRRRARRGRGPGREAQGAGRLQLPRQGVGRARQPQRRGHDRAARLGRCLQGDARVRRPPAARHGLPLRELHADGPQDRPDRPPRRAAGPAVEARPGPVRRRPRDDPGPAAAGGAEGRPGVSGRHARTAPGRAAEAPRLRRSRRQAAADPPRVRRRHAGRAGRPGRRVHHRYRDVLPSGAPATCGAAQAGGSSARSTTARWPTPCRRRSAPRRPTRAGR